MPHFLGRKRSSTSRGPYHHGGLSTIISHCENSFDSTPSILTTEEETIKPLSPKHQNSVMVSPAIKAADSGKKTPKGFLRSPRFGSRGQGLTPSRGGNHKVFSFGAKDDGKSTKVSKATQHDTANHHAPLGAKASQKPTAEEMSTSSELSSDSPVEPPKTPSPAVSSPKIADQRTKLPTNPTWAVSSPKMAVSQQSSISPAKVEAPSWPRLNLNTMGSSKTHQPPQPLESAASNPSPRTTKSPKAQRFSRKKTPKSGDAKTPTESSPRTGGKGFFKGTLRSMKNGLSRRKTGMPSSGGSVVTSAPFPKTPVVKQTPEEKKAEEKPRMRQKLKKTSLECQQEWLRRVQQSVLEAQKSALDRDESLLSSFDEENSHANSGSFVLSRDGEAELYDSSGRPLFSDEMSISSLDMLFHWLTCTMDEIPRIPRMVRVQDDDFDNDPRGMIVGTAEQKEESVQKDDNSVHSRLRRKPSLARTVSYSM